MQRYPDNRPVGYQGMYPYQMPQQPIQIPANPYMEPASQNRQLSLRGRSVASENDIRPNDIVMDGGVSFFPKDDGQAIFVKWWGSNSGNGWRFDSGCRKCFQQYRHRHICQEHVLRSQPREHCQYRYGSGLVSCEHEPSYCASILMEVNNDV